MELTGGNMNNEVMSKICLAGSTAPGYLNTGMWSLARLM